MTSVHVQSVREWLRQVSCHARRRELPAISISEYRRADPQCQTVKADIDAQLDAGTLARDQTYADAWLSGVSRLQRRFVTS